MPTLRIGFIGTGKKPEKAGALGYGMAQQHAAAYAQLPAGAVAIVACADISRENSESFAEIWKVPKSGVYTDYHEMLAKEKLDLVSICTWPHLHAQMAVDSAATKVKGIFCEKPMADTWGGAKRMHAAAVENGVKLVFNHQRRYGKPFRLARKMIDEGRIGKLERVECAPGNLYDYGTHSLDLCNYLNGDHAAKWVMAQIDYRKESLVFGAHNENQALAQWQYENGVYGFFASGLGRGMVSAHNRAIGSEGVIEIGTQGPDEHTRPLRIRTLGAKAWEYIDCAGETCHGPGYIERAVEDIVDCLKTGRECELGSANALKATEIIFAAYESSRSHGRIDLPLTIEDNPLKAMVDAGVLKPQKA